MKQMMEDKENDSDSVSVESVLDNLQSNQFQSAERKSDLRKKKPNNIREITRRQTDT
jgi:hypothetical protein